MKMHKRLIKYVVTKGDSNTGGGLMNRSIFAHLSALSFITEYVRSMMYHPGYYVLSSPTELKKAQTFAGSSCSMSTLYFKLASM